LRHSLPVAGCVIEFTGKLQLGMLGCVRRMTATSQMHVPQARPASQPAMHPWCLDANPHLSPIGFKVN
jgi:hypothetical protein